MPNNGEHHPQKLLVFATDQTADLTPVLSALSQRFSPSDLTVVDPNRAAGLLSADDTTFVDWEGAIAWIRQNHFDAALIFTAPSQSPYTLGYLCFLAGVPVRVGQSCEFGGQVLSHCLAVPEEGDRHLALVESMGWVG